MTTLNMDLAITETAYGKMASALNKWAECQKQNRQLMRDSLYEAQTWMGSSAKKFYDTYNKVDSQINAQLQEYAKLTSDLNNEMLQWKNRADHLWTKGDPLTINIGPGSLEIPTNPNP
jgi:uncharacterized protein YukE